MTTMIDRYCAHLARLNRRPGTIYQQRRTLARLCAWIESDDLLAATVDELRDFTGRGLGDEAAYAEVSRLTTFFRWAVREGFLDVDPTVRLERPSRKPGGTAADAPPGRRTDPRRGTRTVAHLVPARCARRSAGV